MGGGDGGQGVRRWWLTWDGRNGRGWAWLEMVVRMVSVMSLGVLLLLFLLEGEGGREGRVVVITMVTEW